ncbi:MAG: hypothetical protein KGH75_03855 [Rhodospirillales bacterium]|nr:hypothetical protein [Rhodospirillales bacterium]
MSGIIGSINSLTSTETATGLVGLASSLIGVGGFPTLSQWEGLDDAAPSWMWTCDIVNVAGLTNLANVYVREMNFGFNHISASQRYRNGIYNQFPTQTSNSPSSITFYEPYNYSITYYLEQWNLLIRSKDGVYNVPSQYMGSLIIRLYDPTGLQQLMVQLDGVWPISRHPIQLSYAHSDMTVIGCDFSVNTASITYIGTGFTSLIGTGNLLSAGLAVGGGVASGVTGGIVQLI